MSEDRINVKLIVTTICYLFDFYLSIHSTHAVSSTILHEETYSKVPNNRGGGGGGVGINGGGGWKICQRLINGWGRNKRGGGGGGGFCQKYLEKEKFRKKVLVRIQEYFNINRTCFLTPGPPPPPIAIRYTFFKIILQKMAIPTISICNSDHLNF